MRFLGTFCVLFGGLQWGSLLWHYRLDLNALLANWALWGTLILASLLILSGLSFLFRPLGIAARLFAVTCAFYLLGLYAEVVQLYQAPLLRLLGMAAQIAVVVGGLVVLRLSYGLISRPLIKRVAEQSRLGRFEKTVAAYQAKQNQAINSQSLHNQATHSQSNQPRTSEPDQDGR